MRQGSGLVRLGFALLAAITPLLAYGQAYGPLRDERMPPAQQQQSVYDNPQGQGNSPVYNQPQPPNGGRPVE